MYQFTRFILSFLFAGIVAIVKCKYNNPALNLQHSMHTSMSYNSIQFFKAKHLNIVYITVQGLHDALRKLNVLIMSSLYFVAKIVNVHYLIWRWLKISLTRLSYKMNYVSFLKLKFPMKLKLKCTTYIKTYGPHDWVDTWKSSADCKII